MVLAEGLGNKIKREQGDQNQTHTYMKTGVALQASDQVSKSTNITETTHYPHGKN